MNKQDQNLFSVLNIGDLKIKEAMEKGILLVGLTRAGKSTGYNWILRRPMIGQGKPRASYVNIIDDDATAQTKASFTSVTLAPNVHVKLDVDVSLFDMAGYKDSRNYVGTVGVSYFLKAVFEKVREAKFLIVFDEHVLIEDTG